MKSFKEQQGIEEAPLVMSDGELARFNLGEGETRTRKR